MKRSPQQTSIEQNVADETTTDRAYRELRKMAITFQFRPGERINEIALAQQLGLSRTPLREALNRLGTEGFLQPVKSRGYYARQLDAKEIFDLYELRCAVETHAAQLACDRGEDAEFDLIATFLEQTGPTDHLCDVSDLLGFDEEFHKRIARLTGNGEICRVLDNINARIRFVRWIDMEGRRSQTQGEHQAILRHIKARDGLAASEFMRAHISRRLDQIVEVVKEGIVRIYFN